jgi:ComF family protein
MTEAVFSSCGDRIRAIPAKAAVAGPSIASENALWSARRIAVRAAQGFFTVLFPSDCEICGSPLANIARLPVCTECLAAMRPIDGGLCYVCGERVFSAHAAPEIAGGSPIQCGLCQRVEQPFARAVAYGSYDGGLRELIHLLKYSGVRPAADVLGRMLAEAIAELQPGFGSGPIAIAPVPLYRGKLRRRDFNHAELIARAAAKTMRIPHLQLNPGLLIRKRETVSQTGLTRHQRRENVRGAFAIPEVETVKGCEVLVVDDVYTTGATVSECARVLRRAGAAKVWVATVARTLKVVEHFVEARLSESEIAGERELLARAASL